MDVTREFFDQAVQAGTTVDGLVYSEELAGPSGMDIVLMPPDGTAPDTLTACQEELHAEHDIVEFAVRPVPAAWYGETVFKPGPEQGWLEAVRWIVEQNFSMLCGRDKKRGPPRMTGWAAFQCGLSISRSRSER